MHLLPIETIRRFAESFYISDEQRRHTDAFITLAIKEPLAHLAYNIVTLAENLDEKFDNLTSGTFFQILESLTQQSPEPYFHAIQSIAQYMLEKGGESYHEPKYDATHYSYLTSADQLIRVSITQSDTYRSATIQVGSPNPDRPSLEDQYNDNKPIINSHYYKNGKRTEFKLNFSTLARPFNQFSPPFGVKAEIRHFKEGTGVDTDYNGTPTTYEPKELPEWLDELNKLIVE